MEVRINRSRSGNMTKVSAISLEMVTVVPLIEYYIIVIRLLDSNFS